MLGIMKLKNFNSKYIIPCYEKITKSDICNSEQCKLSKPQNLSDFVFLWSLENKLSHDEIWQIC
jgi:hypothetical protein